MPSLETTTNCGIYELSEVRDFTDGRISVREFFQHLHDDLDDLDRNWKYPGIIFFSDARERRSRVLTAGDKLAEYIMTHHLGEMTWSEWKKNPNTGNYIRMWMWYPNVRNTDCHMKQLGVDL